MPEPTFFMDFPQIKIWGWGREDVRPDRPESTYHGYIAYDIPKIYVSNNERYWVDITSGIVGDTYTVKVSVDDTTAAYLEGKIAVVAPLQIDILNDGANEQLQISIPAGAITSEFLADEYAALVHTHVLADITDAGDLASLDTVGTAQIDNDAVNGTKIADNSIELAHMTDDSVGTDELIDESVTEDKLHPDVVAQLGGGADAVKVTSFDFTEATSSPNDFFSPPANADIIRVVIELPTAATGGGAAATLKIGNASDDDYYLEAAQIDLYDAAVYEVECWMNAGGTPQDLRLTLTPDSNTFAGTVNVFYAIPS
jgi:hypothetical protein